MFEGDIFTDEPLPQSDIAPMGNDSDDDMDGGWGDRSAPSR